MGDPPTVHPAPTEQDLREVLREAGLRTTPMRLALLRRMRAARAPASAQQIFDDVAAGMRGDRPDRVTVYRTLNALVEHGLAHKVDPGDRVFRFSLTDHARCDGERHVHEHPHFVCDECGIVECLEGEKVVIRGRGREPAKRRVKQEGVVLHGTCEGCVEEPAKRS